MGRLVLDVDSAGGYSLRAYPEGSEDPGRDLLAVGVVHADGNVAIHVLSPLIHPSAWTEGLSAVDGEQGDPGSEQSSNV